MVEALVTFVHNKESNRIHMAYFPCALASDLKL